MTRRSIALVSVCLLVFVCFTASCDGSVQPPNAPSPPPAANPEPAPVPQPQPPGPPVVTGVVYEHREGRQPTPLPGLRFTAMIGQGELVPVVTDGQGQYSVTAVKDGLFAINIPSNAGFRAPCPAGSDYVPVSTRIDIDVVADAVLASSGVPASYPRPRTILMVEGTVVESGGQRQPMSGVTVDMGVGMYTATSATLTNARGEYFLCTNPPGTGTDQMTPMRASKAGFDTSVRDISMGNETRVDFELRRR